MGPWHTGPHSRPEEICSKVNGLVETSSISLVEMAKARVTRSKSGSSTSLADSQSRLTNGHAKAVLHVAEEK